MTTLTSAQVIGMREDLENEIYLVSPQDTPFSSNIKNKKATNTYHSWQLDTIDPVVANNSVFEGSDANPGNPHLTTRAGNALQHFRKSGQVSDTLEWTVQAGRGSELTFQKLRAGVALKRDIEYALLRNQPSILTDGANPRQLGGAQTWIHTNAYTGNAGSTVGFVTNTSVTGSVVHGANRAFTEALFKTAIQGVFQAGSRPDMALMGMNMKQEFASFTGIALNRREIKGNEQATIIGAADVYVGDTGDIAIVPHAYALYNGAGGGDETANSVLLITPENFAIGTGTPIVAEDLARTGSSTKFMLNTEKTLICGNEKAHAYITDLV